MENTENKISLLAKLINDDVYKLSDIEKQYDAVYKIINKDFSDILSESIIPYKSKVLKKLNKILEKIEILVLYPELIGKTVLGVVGSNDKYYKILMPKIVSKDTLSKLAMNTNVPCICLQNTVEKIAALNSVEKDVTLSDDEYKDITQDLYKHKIDIRNLVNTFSIFADIKFENISIIHFPEYVQKNKEFNTALEEKVDCFFLCGDVKNKKNMQNLCFLSKNYFKPIYVILEENERDSGNKDISKIDANISVLSTDRVGDILNSLDHPRVNFKFVDEIKLCLLEIDKFYSVHINKLESMLANVNADLVKIDHDETNDKVKNIRNGLKKTLEHTNTFYSKVKSRIEDLIKNSLDLEELLEKTTDCTINEFNDLTLYHSDRIDIWTNLVLGLIEIKEFRKAKEYIEKLKEINFKYKYILELLVSKAKKESIPGMFLSKLRDEDEGVPLVQKAKIALGEDMNLTISNLLHVAGLIKNPTTINEYYFKAQSFENTNIDQAIKLYFIALEMGHIPSGERLFELSKTNTINIEILAQNMVPVANYQLGMQIKNKQYAKGITNLKMAATQGYLPAIKYLADEFYGKVMSSYYKSLSDAEIKDKYDNVLGLYLYILSKEPNNVDVVEKLGNLMYKLEDYRRAMEYLQQCNTSNALYKCGNMYQYGKGAAQDLQKAKDYLYQASQKGNAKATLEYEKVVSWIKNNSNRSSSYSSQRNYSSTSSYSSKLTSSDSFCFITTATCFALDKEDNCPELLTIKKYRDVMKSQDKNVNLLIKEYYRIAPSIVSAIDIDENSKNIYLELWEQYISKTYAHILKQEYSDATSTYVNMVKHLCDKYNVELSQEIETIIQSNYASV